MSWRGSHAQNIIAAANCEELIQRRIIRTPCLEPSDLRIRCRWDFSGKAIFPLTVVNRGSGADVRPLQEDPMETVQVPEGTTTQAPPRSRRSGLNC
jgi:hypothetical protein